MRWPGLRFSMRWLMMAVVVVALAVEAEVMRRNRAYYQERAAYQARQAYNERNSSRMVQDRVLRPVNETETGMFRYIARTRTERAEWHDALRGEMGVGCLPSLATGRRHICRGRRITGPIDFVEPTYPPPGRVKPLVPATSGS